MAVEWNAHRFSGGALALSAANTVVMRLDPGKMFDRFDDADELPRFAAAATVHCAAEFDGATIAVADPAHDKATVIAVREAVDRLFRHQARDGVHASAALADLLAIGAKALAGFDADLPVVGTESGNGPRDLPLSAAMTLSALSLLRREMAGRIKICPNCAWLFVDKSRNAARLWCDMAVCGNRAKAKRHYRRRKTEVRQGSD